MDIVLVSIWYRSWNTATVGERSRFLQSYRLDFHMIDAQSIALPAFAKRMLTLVSVNKVLQLKYVNRSTNLRDLPLKVEMVNSCLKYMDTVLLAFTLEQILSSACSWLCSGDSVWAVVFAGSAASSAKIVSVIVFCGISSTRPVDIKCFI